MIDNNRFNRYNVLVSLVLLVYTPIIIVSRPGAEDCWWTGCQPNSWAVTGCANYNRTEKARKPCDDGFVYRCCVLAPDGGDEFLADQCWWSECGRTSAGCPSDSVSGQTRKCRAAGGGDLHQHHCCVKKSALIDDYNEFRKTNHHANVFKYLMATLRKQRAPEYDYEKSGLYQVLDYEEKAKTNGGNPDSDGDGDVRRQTEAGGSTGGRRPSGNANGTVREGGMRIVGYYTSWGENVMDDQTMAMLTHVIYAFTEMREDGSVDFASDAARERLQNLMELSKSHPDVKIMFAVGGGTNSQYFSQTAASSDRRASFVASVVQLLDTYGFHGVDIDWEFPTADDKSNYVLLMQDLRQGLDAFAEQSGRQDAAAAVLLSFAGAAGQWALDPGYDLPGLLAHADFANVMAYDYFGVWPDSEWGAYTGPPAPLHYCEPAGTFGQSYVDWTVTYYADRTGAPGALNVGVPFYGWYWRDAGDPVDAADPMWRRARPGRDGRVHGGAVQWRRIPARFSADAGFRTSFHDGCKAPYAWNEDARVFLGYEDAESLAYKARYAAEKNAGGLMVWAVDMDDDDHSLLSAVVSSARRRRSV